MNRLVGIFAAGILVAALAGAEPMVEVEQLPCLAKEINADLAATASGLGGGDTVRAHFRRLHPTGAFYFVEMVPDAGGRWWSVLPKPEDREQQSVTDEWWEESLQHRDWLDGRSRSDLEDLFDSFENEAAEYFVAAYDAAGERIAETETMLVQVRDRDDCEIAMSAAEVGMARNLTVGETSEQQVGKPVFHWLCDGIVTRLGSNGVLRGDDVCRGCVVAMWMPAATAAGAVVAATTIEHREPRRISPDRP